jgi:hypothetical protein
MSKQHRTGEGLPTVTSMLALDPVGQRNLASLAPSRDANPGALHGDYAVLHAKEDPCGHPLRDWYWQTGMWQGAILGRSRRLLPGSSDLDTWFGLVVGPGSCRAGSAHGFDLSFPYDRLGTLHGKHTRNKGER